MNDEQAIEYTKALTVVSASLAASAAALAMSALTHPNGRKLLDQYERNMIAGSIPNFANSKAPPFVGETYRHAIAEVFKIARKNAGFVD